ncbi:Oidioi.mRNA.OKI2018_I69.XSR.g16771.t1.cds [Oikopleura dioica]|uniref:Oidioi.mRNA.OKI2018_I69.XSR.g16771.t1.cds n=1 Tax=Oikopleura dioica TaxID=34765 RepID=A0ABN7SLZ3_OIKDI|nr:Oidioi.mRNA.OKI2018_I69.XSR.g16771.t1.cds [Oikopleura dioica]
MDPRPFINAYSAKTRVGNWNEDLFRIDGENQDYERLKAAGQLRNQIVEKIRSRFCAPVKTTGHGDKQLRFGDIVEIKNDAFESTVAVHTDNDISWTVSACSKSVPSKRTCYRVVPCAESSEDSTGKSVFYGQPFSLQSCVEPGWFLASDSIEKLQSLSNIAYGRNRVFLLKSQSKATMWSVTAWDPRTRPEFEDTPVLQNTTSVLVHHSTGQALCCEDSSKVGFFGREKEVCCSTRLTPFRFNSARG